MARVGSELELLGTLVTRDPRSIDLSREVIDDRVARYLADEPLHAIAADHGVTIAAILGTVKRHAPSCYGGRQRGPRGWRAEL